MRTSFLVIAGDTVPGISWSAHIRALGLTLPELPVAAEFPAAVVFARGSVSRRSSREIVLGSVFSRMDAPQEERFGNRDVDNAFSEDLRTIWGDYVIVRDEAPGISVLRAPFGKLPCYYVRWTSATIIVSDITFLQTIGLSIPALSWKAITLHLIAPELRAEETCLAGVRELIGGRSLSIMRGKAGVRQVWSPWPYADRSAQLSNVHEARLMLRRTIDACISAHCGLYPHILLGVSGGLDSSIVAAVMALSCTQTTLVTMVAADRAGDERYYARLLAAHLQLPLVEGPEDVRRVDLRVSRSGHLPRPLARSFAQSSDDAFISLARNGCVDAFFSGAGGDNIFWNLTSAAAVLDTMIGGFGMRATLRNAGDLARMCGTTVAHVLFKALRLAGEGGQVCWPSDRSFLSQDIRSLTSDDHPWLVAPQGALPGKIRHVHCIMGIENHLEGYGREAVAPMVAPLLSQPVVEACLRIPTWMWCRGARDRALAREAYADCLPAAILTRMEKGTPFGFALQLFEKNRATLREILLEGALARERLLDRDAIETCLARDDPAAGLAHYRLLCIADVEAWVQHREALAARSG